MSWIEDIRKFQPCTEQEQQDKAQMLDYIETHDRVLWRDDPTAHITVSAWTVNEDRTKTLMVYHKIYDSWSWIGGHADGDDDLKAVALRELQEETGIRYVIAADDGIISLEILPVSGHIKRDVYVSSHLHLNVTYLFVADDTQALTINDVENTGVRWFSFEEALRASSEPWMVEHIYRKLIKRSR